MTGAMKLVAKLMNDTEVVLEVVEWQPEDPSAYVTVPGWTCTGPPDDTEYFVDITGDVWRQPENVIVGYCEAADRWAAEA